MEDDHPQGGRLEEVSRRDYEPHRGDLLSSLGLVSFALGFLSLCTVFPSLLSLPLGVAVWLTAKHDLKRIQKGLMHPGGEDQTREALTTALAGVLFSWLVWIGCSMFLLYLNQLVIVDK